MENDGMESAVDLGTWLGRRQAFAAVAGRCSAADAECLRTIREKKLYRACGLNWEEFCRQRAGISRSLADQMVRQLVEPLHDPISAACVAAERAMLAALDGSCRTPIAGFAEIDADRLKMEGLLLNEHGSREIRGRFEGGIDDAAQLGAELGKDLRSRAGPDFGLG